MDVPPFKVLNNSVLIELVRRPPASPHDLFNRPGISYRVARRFAADILKTISDARHQNPFFLEVPARNNWKPASRSAKLRLEALKQWRQEKARQLNLPLGVVFPANVLENLALAPSAGPEDLLSIPGMRRWRVRSSETSSSSFSTQSSPRPSRRATDPFARGHYLRVPFSAIEAVALVQQWDRRANPRRRSQ